MRRGRVRAYMGLAVVALLALAADFAFAEDTGGFPYGKYAGSAVGTDGSRESRPIDVSVYLSHAGDGRLEVTVVTSKLPVPVSVTAPIKGEDGSWEIPVVVDAPRARVSGTGTLHVRKRDGSWVIWGEGQGTALGKSGSGRGFARRISARVSVAEQVMNALKGFLRLGAEEPAAVEAPPPFDEGGGTEAQASIDEGAQQTSEGEPAAPQAPLTVTEQISMIGLFVLLTVLGLFL